MNVLIEAALPLEEVLAGLDVAGLADDECLLAVETLSRVERLCAATRLRVAGRVAQTNGHVAAGHRSAAAWLATVAGTSTSRAAKTLATVATIEELPQVSQAFAAGLLSEAQAETIASAAVANPAAEAELLETAFHGDLARLRDKARQVRDAAETDPEDRHRRQHAAREFDHWIDDDGMVAGRFRLTPDVGVPLVNRVDRETDRVYRQAYRDGRREERRAYAADAFATIAGGAGGAAAMGGRTDLVVVVDVAALQRGHAHQGERCHLPGVGPVPVEVARRVAGDAFLKGVLIDGVEIVNVKHFGRHIPAEVRTALELGEPPALDGAVCGKTAAVGAPASSGTTTTPSPTTVRPPSRISTPAAVPTIATRPNATAAPASSAQNAATGRRPCRSKPRRTGRRRVHAGPRQAA
jgi:hypothetical protein